ncbi:MAG: hypothetical protein BMS9Abin18_1281 [Zetaproteobacteria bacterium]|nr:MAG: hypothetical protein BMS9Abin18_1281 [Zetaproteobacteria bacterium]
MRMRTCTNNINKAAYGFIYVVASTLFILFMPVAASAQDKQEYLYQRDVTVPAYQTLREFFDMPNRPGKYEVTLVSDSMGPLTFRILRVRGEHEQTVKRMRSYHMKSHEFQAPFNNPRGTDDLIVEIANSNPAVNARVSVYVVEVP